MSALTTVMYHYVRPLGRSLYPGIKGLELSAFEEQLAFFRKHYSFVSLDDCLGALAGRELPPHPLLLTFDDGFSDHYRHVFPILDRHKIPGAFFPPARAIREKTVLDVHKVHFILACTRDVDDLIRETFSLLESCRQSHQLEAPSALFQRLAVASRFDSKEVVFFKRLFQRGLPARLRAELLGRLFSTRVARDEAEFAEDLYMSQEQLACMLRHGMHVGSHGYGHEWLDSLSIEEQAKDIDLSLDFLASIGIRKTAWTMCYPYGAYNDATLAILRERGCALGLTTIVGITRLEPGNALTLERLDTNDFPKRRDAPPPQWSAAARA